MPSLTLSCPCGAKFKRHDSRVREGRTYYCSRECQQARTTRSDGTYRCASCKEWKPRGAYRWHKDLRYSAGERRNAYCQTCLAPKLREYHAKPASKAKARQQHAKWRERCLAKGGDVALRWYFARQKGGYSRRARAQNVPFDLDADFLVALFHKQEGRCFYTGAQLEWDAYGKKHPSAASMSVDRRDPQRGYTKENVVLCTYQMNTTKGARSEADLYDLCRLILDRAEAREDSSH